MKKLIIKTIIITIVSIIAATLLAYCTLALLMPGRLAKAYDNLGFEKSAVKLMARKYDRSEDLSDLITLCTYAEKTGDNRLIAQHFAKLFEDEEFLNYTKTIEDGSEFYDLFAGKYVVALHKTGKDERFVVDTAFALTHAYVKYNPVQALIVSALEGETIDAETLVFIKDNLQTLLTSATEAESQLITNDYNFILGVITQ